MVRVAGEEIADRLRRAAPRGQIFAPLASSMKALAALPPLRPPRQTQPGEGGDEVVRTLGGNGTSAPLEAVGSVFETGTDAVASCNRIERLVGGAARRRDGTTVPVPASLFVDGGGHFSITAAPHQADCNVDFRALLLLLIIITSC